MRFTDYENSVINELGKRAGDVLYLSDIAPFFITKSCLNISTYLQTAYIKLGDNMQKSLSEYFQLIVFIKKLEDERICYSIPYTPLEDNAQDIGNLNYKDYQQQTIADGDLLLQIFQFATKKYVISPVEYDEEQIKKAVSTNRLIPNIILALLFLFLAAIGYQSYRGTQIRTNQLELIENKLSKQIEVQNLLSEEINQRNLDMDQFHQLIQDDLLMINKILETQIDEINRIKYWNRMQVKELMELNKILVDDSTNH